VEEEFADGGVFGEADRAIVGVRGLAGLAETLQEVGADGPVGLIAGDSVLITSNPERRVLLQAPWLQRRRRRIRRECRGPGICGAVVRRKVR
jgi:hypothetical protein